MVIKILIYAFVFSCGTSLGLLLKAWLDYKFRDYSGTIVVNRDRLTEKTVYSLELDDYPEKLEFKKIVIFRVDNPKEGLDRE